MNSISLQNPNDFFPEILKSERNVMNFLQVFVTGFHTIRWYSIQNLRKFYKISKLFRNASEFIQYGNSILCREG